MALSNQPFFTQAVNNNSAITSATADTSLTAPTHGVTVFTAGSNGSNLSGIRINQVLTTNAAGIINIFLYNGTTYYLFDIYIYQATTLSTTAEVQPIDVGYNNFPLDLKTGWTVVATNTVASNTAGTTAATHCVSAFGGDY